MKYLFFESMVTFNEYTKILFAMYFFYLLAFTRSMENLEVAKKKSMIAQRATEVKLFSTTRDDVEVFQRRYLVAMEAVRSRSILFLLFSFFIKSRSISRR